MSQLSTGKQYTCSALVRETGEHSRLEMVPPPRRGLAEVPYNTHTELYFIGCLVLVVFVLRGVACVHPEEK